MPSPIETLIAFSRLPGVGSGLYWQVVEAHSSFQLFVDSDSAAWSQFLSAEAAQQFREFIDNPAVSKLAQTVRLDVEWCEKNNIRLLSGADPLYPSLLKECHRSPPLLYVKGDPQSLSLPQIAMVGSRKPSSTGRRNAQDFASSLAASGFAITSGLALGIDGLAHSGALEVNGITVAVLGTGIDIIYPHRHNSLANAIVENGGAIVSEFPLGTLPRPAHFPQRNRIISGLACGVLVVEAAIRSGSLITARYALAQDREVFAIPGSIHNQMSAGCHHLIKQGAKLVECCGDIVEEIRGVIAHKVEEMESNEWIKPDENSLHLSELEAKIIDVLGSETLLLDELLAEVQLPIDELLPLLVAMEIRGIILSTGSGYCREMQKKS